ncbi:MAG: DUF177 domain-containing protein [Candidatus Omnitrophica bacterium]|nr:DUF177 domain-containing protein [Candidatus Omnitrophota bacterium]
MDSFDIKFIDTLSVTADFTRIKKDIYVQTEVISKRIIVCSRCMDKVKQTVRQNFHFHFDRSGLRDTLEMDNAIREEILLHFPMKVLCKTDCKGLCTVCGSNLNHSRCDCQKAIHRDLSSSVTAGRFQEAEGDTESQILEREYIEE